VFVERLWRSVKYEEVYLRAYEGISDARASIGRDLDFYNSRRPHSGLDGITPDHAYFTPLPLRLAAEAPLIEAKKLFRQPTPALGKPEQLTLLVDWNGEDFMIHSANGETLEPNG